MSRAGSIIDRFQRAVAKNRSVVWLAAKLRNQCNRIIGYSVCGSPRAELNGEEWLLRLLSGKIETVFDVGANRGDWTDLVLRSSKAARKVVLFEPSVSVCSSLNDRFATNSVVEVLQLAVGDSSGTMNFYESSQSSEASSFWPEADQPSAAHYAVRVTTVDDECDRLGLKRLDFLKIDTEGNDFYVLRGAKLLLQSQSIGVVQFEYGANWVAAGATLRRAVDFLTSFGYRVFALKPNRIEGVSTSTLGEYFGYSNFVALSNNFQPLFSGQMKS